MSTMVSSNPAFACPHAIKAFGSSRASSFGYARSSFGRSSLSAPRRHTRRHAISSSTPRMTTASDDGIVSGPMTGIVLYGIGSTLIVDVEESLHRAGIPIIAGIRNHRDSHLSDGVPVLLPEDLTPETRSLPFL